jgi:hypothetical protein
MAKLIDIRPGEVIRIGADTLVTMEHKSGQRARLRIETNESVSHLKAVDPREAPKTPGIAPPLFKRA